MKRIAWIFQHTSALQAVFSAMRIGTVLLPMPAPPPAPPPEPHGDFRRKKKHRIEGKPKRNVVCARMAARERAIGIDPIYRNAAVCRDRSKAARAAWKKAAEQWGGQ